jgi:hypothetical protein
MQVRPKLVTLDATNTLFRVRGSVGEAYVRYPCHRFIRGGGRLITSEAGPSC